MAIARYQKKISGPLLDRIDIHVEVPCVDYEQSHSSNSIDQNDTITAVLIGLRVNN